MGRALKLGLLWDRLLAAQGKIYTGTRQADCGQHSTCKTEQISDWRIGTTLAAAINPNSTLTKYLVIAYCCVTNHTPAAPAHENVNLNERSKVLLLLLYAAKQRPANPKTNAILSSLLRSIKIICGLDKEVHHRETAKNTTNKRDSRRHHRCLVQTHQCQLRTTIRTTFQGTQRTFENTQVFGTSKSRWRKLRCIYV